MSVPIQTLFGLLDLVPGEAGDFTTISFRLHTDSTAVAEYLGVEPGVSTPHRVRLYTEGGPRQFFLDLMKEPVPGLIYEHELSACPATRLRPLTVVCLTEGPRHLTTTTEHHFSVWLAHFLTRKPIVTATKGREKI
ncbi:MAG: hypothetical protein AAB691_01580 [Patescibacteria group bacterium]